MQVELFIFSTFIDFETDYSSVQLIALKISTIKSLNLQVSVPVSAFHINPCMKSQKVANI